MKVRYLADANLDQRIVVATRQIALEIDFKTAHEARLHGVPDGEVLVRAAAEGRLLVTHDLATMPGHFAEFIASRVSHGVILLPQTHDIAAAATELFLIWAASESEEWANRIAYLPL